ncbi:MAG: hypothetical protein ABSA93_03670 [Streptosporangiaceae bacterium]
MGYAIDYALPGPLSELASVSAPALEGIYDLDELRVPPGLIK